MLKIENLSKTFHDLEAVSNLQLNIPAGQIYALVGPNGAGKTTTIKMITGLLKPDQGQIWIDNYSVLNEPEKAKSIFGYIPDEPFILGKLTGREILRFTAQLWDLKDNGLEAKINELLDIYQLNNIADSLFDDYSRGNKQKLVILAALLHEPKFLIFDEPIVGLDPKSILQTHDVLLAFKENGGSVLISTHTLSFAEKVCDRVGFICNGKIILEKDSDFEQKDLEQIYLDVIHS